MTKVWMTARGARYHRHSNCEGIRDGHAEARSRGYSTYEPRELELWQAEAHSTACLRCWAPAFAENPALGSLLDIEAKTETSYEAHFLTHVLGEVEGLRTSDIVAQREVRGASGRVYRLDFAIERRGQRPIALEIDGLEKTQGVRFGSAEAQDQANRRRNDLAAAGWLVLHFSNRAVMTAPDNCVREIAEVLRVESNESPRSADDLWMRSEQRKDMSPPTPRVMDAPTRTASQAQGVASSSLPQRTSPPGDGVGWFALIALLVAGGVLAFVVFSPLGGAEPEPSGGDERAEPSSGQCPRSHPVKGNQSESGSWIFHEPGWRYYDSTYAEECFATSAAARSAGYRESKVQ